MLYCLKFIFVSALLMIITDRLQLDSQRVYTDEGFLKVPAKIGRTGIQHYTAGELGLADRKPNEVIAIYRPDSEVFKPESLASFAGKPVTDDHPLELVNAANARKYIAGFSSDTVDRDGDYIITTLTITDQTAIEKIKSGKVELSNGYICDHVWGAGVTDSGENYDAIQTNIIGNHIALVERGRAGAACRIADRNSLTNEDQKMIVTIEGIDYEVSDQVAQAVGKMLEKLATVSDELEKKDEMIEEVKEEAKKTEDSLKAKLDDARSKIMKPDQVDQLIADRMTLIENVKRVAPTVDWAGKTNAQLISDAVAANCPNVQLDSVSSDYIRARFDMLLETANNDPTQSITDALYKRHIGDKKTDQRTPSQIARDNMIARSQSAWKRGA